MAEQRTVSGLPTGKAKLAFENTVYVNESDPLIGVCEWVCVRTSRLSGVYPLSALEGVAAGTLAMSGPQRTGIKTSDGLSVTVEPINRDSVGGLALVGVNLSIDLIKRKNVAISEDEVVEYVHERFKTYLFCENQVLACDFQGTSIRLVVTGVELVSVGEEKREFRDRGFIVSEIETTVTVKVGPKDEAIIQFKPTSRKSRNTLAKINFLDMGIGGLDKEFEQIFRRAFVSRSFPPHLVKQLNLDHVKGMLLHGPPGTGKTLIARKIGEMLNARPPKVVDGPSVFSKFVGETEQNIRDLFADAEAEYLSHGEESELHIIIFDEIDAICKARGSVNSGTGVHDTVVNQLLSKIDGVDSLNNILIIGMTNRKDMIDPAILRPGRLEVHVEIGLPDEAGRRDIFKIHTSELRDNKVLSEDVDLAELASLTKNYSGAEIKAVVRDARSFAMYEKIDLTSKSAGGMFSGIETFNVTRQHFLQAVHEVQPAFGIQEDQLTSYIRGGIIPFGTDVEHVLSVGRKMIAQLRSSENTSLLSLLLEGKAGSGKSALAAHLGIESDFPFVKVITANDMVGYSETNKLGVIAKVFDDAYKSPLSLIVLDNIERLLDYVRIGPRFSNTILQALMVLTAKFPPREGCKLMIVGTTSDSELLDDFCLRSSFQVNVKVPLVDGSEQVAKGTYLSLCIIF